MIVFVTKEGLLRRYMDGDRLRDITVSLVSPLNHDTKGRNFMIHVEDSRVKKLSAKEGLLN